MCVKDSLGRGAARFALGDYQGAIADYTQTIKLDPESAALAYSNRALARERVGDSKGASEDRQQAAKLPKQPETRVFETVGGTRQCNVNPASSSP